MYICACAGNKQKPQEYEELSYPKFVDLLIIRDKIVGNLFLLGEIVQGKENIKSIQPTGEISHLKTEPLKSEGELYLGIDAGSTSCDIAVLSSELKLIYSDYRRTMGKPLETINEALETVFKKFNKNKITFAAATGSASRLIASLLEIPYINEVSAQAAAIAYLYPHFPQATVIEMGGQDSKLLFLKTENGRPALSDFALNSACAAGTGSFLDQQAQRLGVNIENEFGKMALAAKSVPTIAGRCSVFAKSDMIHLQQQATPVENIIAGLCLALARNLKSNLGKGREFTKPIIFTGGVAANQGVVNALKEVLDLQAGQLIVPQEHFFTGAIGAVLATRNSSRSEQKINIEKFYNYFNAHSRFDEKAPRREALRKPLFAAPEGKVCAIASNQKEKIDAWIGVDVGSISTNVVVIDKDKNVLSKAYLMTAGRPLEAVKKGLQMAAADVGTTVNICGAATTGSGRYLTGDFIGADVVINEITAQAAGAAVVCPKVDTIFEIGGQDSKFISLKNGVVVDFEMNHACAAGTGSFLEEQAERLGINIKDEFASLAFESKAPIKLGERCTVFMESDLLDYQQQGAQTKDLVAGLAYSIVTNYLNRVVGRRKLGDNICFQGGTAFNKAVWAAFEKILGKAVRVPDHHEVTGALGAAVIAKVRTQGASSFRGFENLVHLKYDVESFVCQHCSNNCEIKKVILPGSEPLFYGSRCDRYNVSRAKKHKKSAAAFEFRNEMLRKFAKIDENGIEPGKKKIGIPMALINWQYLPLFSIFLKNIGFDVIATGPTSRLTAKKGVESVTAEQCFPVKVAFGHIAELIEQQADYIFVPSVVSLENIFKTNKHSKLCPYVQSLPYQARAAFGDKLGKSEILTPVIRLGDGRKPLIKSFTDFASQLKVKKGLAEKAVEAALEAQKEFETSLVLKGEAILSSIGDSGRLCVLIGRPYNSCDAQMNLQLADKLTAMGIDVLPLDMLPLGDARLENTELHGTMYWGLGQKILRGAELIKNDPRLFGVYLSNFSCGPDSFLETFFRGILAEKPSLFLELDEHSADAGLVTRLEAFFDSLSHYSQGQKKNEKIKFEKLEYKDRKLFIPFMSDCSYGMAATFKALGKEAEVMRCSDEEGLILGRRLMSGKECLPCAITAGDMLLTTQREDFDPAKSAFLMPSASGPCRFGLYNCMQKMILQFAGFDNIPIVAPNQDTKFYTEIAQTVGEKSRRLMIDAWTAMVGIDVMRKVLLKVKSRAVDRTAAQAIYDEWLKCWLKSVESNKSLSDKKKIMAEFADKFSQCPKDYSLSKPRIGVVGEIYVRSHPFANNNIIERLEELGADCSLAPLAEWVYYTNYMRMLGAKRKGMYGQYLLNVGQDFIQHKIERILAAPLEKKFGYLAEHDVKSLLKLGEKYIDKSFEGEAILSVSKIIEYHKQGFAGVINVMPFTCMPSTIVSSLIPQLSRDCGNMPILNITFDGTEDVTFATRLEAFYQQCCQRDKALATRTTSTISATS
ncbi:MAG: R-phenyllactate dehydratase activator [Planctomycetes bacterium ADurb.Bin401]|nr:MAG: R-phenyllactate dehydratase activator [Planctomycetes bacterium ADurb.Bin401]